MNTNANPSIDPANDDTLKGTLRAVFLKLLQSTDGMLPATVINFKRGLPSRVQVQPDIMVIDTQGNRVSRGQIASLPVLQLGGGNVVLSFNLEPGDRGWIFASDRDISNFLQSYSESSPQTFRIKNFADALFIPDMMQGYSLASEDQGNAVLQTRDGTVKIAIWPTKIKIAAPTIEIEATDAITMTAPLTTINGATTITGLVNLEQGFTSEGGGTNNAIFTGNVFVTGNISATGDITPHV